MRTPLLSAREQYVEDLFAREDAGLANVRERLLAAGKWGVNIGANEGRILQILLRLMGAKTGIEIGTLYGYSAVWLARALPESGQLYTIERDPEALREAQETFRVCEVNERVTQLSGDATDRLKDVEHLESVDFVFIDANKSGYCSYLQWAERFVRPGGLIIADNTLLGGGVLLAEKPDHISFKQWSEMRRFNASLANENQYLATILPTPEGLTVAIKL